MRPAREVARSRGDVRAGFSLVELLVAMMVGSVVSLGVISMIISENTRLSQQRELGDTWLTLRSATEVLGYDLRQASVAAGDLTAITDSSFTIRARRGFGIVCAQNKAMNVFALTGVTGEFSAEAGDSVQILTVESKPARRNVRVQSAGPPTGQAPTTCAWANKAPAETTVKLAIATPRDSAGVQIGSLMQAFRSTEYGIMTSSERRWLGRRVAGGSWEIVTGPLGPDGLSITYYTSTGATTAIAADVATVRITLRGQSFGRTNQRQVMIDTITVRVHPRN